MLTLTETRGIENKCVYFNSAVKKLSLFRQIHLQYIYIQNHRRRLLKVLYIWLFDFGAFLTFCSFWLFIILFSVIFYLSYSTFCSMFGYSTFSCSVSYFQRSVILCSVILPLVIRPSIICRSIIRRFG
jgi:hypothetical protein